MDRRAFIKSSGLLVLGAAHGIPGFLARVAAAPDLRRKTLVVIFQRGACDGLSQLPPVGDPHYPALRPNIAVGGAVTRLDGVFGMPPALASLQKYWEEGTLAFVHQAGSPDPTRSHFDAQDFMESGTPGLKATSDGYLNRVASSLPKSGRGVFSTVGLAATLPRSLWGSETVLSMPSLKDFSSGALKNPSAGEGFEAMYASSTDPLFRKVGKETVEAFRKAQALGEVAPEHGADYPKSEMGRRMKDVAALIKSGVGLRVVAVDSGGWDTHAGQGAQEGRLAKLLKDWADSISSFAQDLGKRMEDVVLVSMTEFGRTAKENGNRGTDHGHGAVMTVLGGPVRGKRVIAAGWKGLAPADLYEGRDVPVTTDYRTVMGEILTGHLGVSDLKRIFPDFAGPARVGILRG